MFPCALCVCSHKPETPLIWTLMIKSVLLLVAAVSFGLGISLPLIRFDRFYFLSDTPSLIDVTFELWNTGEFLLTFLVVLFSIVFPLAKMLTAFHAASHNSQLPQWVSILGKWSLMDVLLVAIVIFAAKTSGFASAFAQPGVWFYTISAVLTAVATSSLIKKH